MGRKKKKQTKPWCWYCNREFEDEKILIQHQKAKHFKCHICAKKLFTGPGLAIHCMQVHKETIDKIPCAVPGRESVNIEIYGMEGVPLDAEMGVSEEPVTKQPKITIGSIPTPAMPPAGPFGAMIPTFGMPPGMPPFGIPHGMPPGMPPIPGMPLGMPHRPPGQMPMPSAISNASGGGGPMPPMPANLPPPLPPSNFTPAAAFPAYQQQAAANGGMRNNGTPVMAEAEDKKPHPLPPPLPNSARHQPSAITIKAPSSLSLGGGGLTAPVGFTATTTSAAAKTRMVCPDELISLEEHKFSILQRQQPFASAFDGRGGQARGVGIAGSYAGQNFRR